MFVSRLGDSPLVAEKILLVAHGTVERMEDMPGFLSEIRRGRPVPPELLDEMIHRYEHVGGSPLLRLTEEQAQALAQVTGLETRVAMRLWSPRVEDVTADWGPQDRVTIVPMAPFSIGIYEGAARAALGKRDDAPQIACVAPWGKHPALIDAFVADIQEKLRSCPAHERTRLVLSAHSLPVAVIRAGDTYAQLFEETAALVAAGVNVDHRVCYQSQGASGGEWLGPDLLTSLEEAKKDGIDHVVVSPIGFLAEHIETLYDLDVEAREQCGRLGLQLHRVKAIGTHPGLIRTLADAVAEAK